MSALQLAPMLDEPVTVDDPHGDDCGDVLTLRYTNSGKSSYRRRLMDHDPHCIYCGKRLTDKSVTLEHALPQSKGGNHQPWNLFLSCGPCNSERSSRDILEWVAELRAKADRLELAYHRMMGDVIETDAPEPRWPVAIAFVVDGA